MFRRAESSSFFGREIGLMYVHAHLRYAEAMAILGDVDALWDALQLASPIAVTDRLAQARPGSATPISAAATRHFQTVMRQAPIGRRSKPVKLASKEAGGSIPAVQAFSRIFWSVTSLDIADSGANMLPRSPCCRRLCKAWRSTWGRCLKRHFRCPKESAIIGSLIEINFKRPFTINFKN